MRLVTFAVEGGSRVGALRDDEVVDLHRADPDLPGEIVALLQGGAAALRRVAQAVAGARTGSPAVYPLAGVRLLAPVPRPPKILCVGRNYADHAAEVVAAGAPPTERPSIFVKVSSAVIGSGEPIVHPTTTQQLDYEGELAVVIGRRAKAVSREQALDHVAGYTIFNDVSARDLQFSKSGGITIGKNFDTAAPMGPWIVLTDEIPDPANLRLRTSVSGELRQDASTRDLIFDVPAILSFISQQLTLEPGDVIATGTPAGVGFGRKPQVWLKPGDTVRIEIDGIGALENPVGASRKPLGGIARLLDRRGAVPPDY
ncbi:MAG: fumarylacetoacetate hydrolase family protein [Chloroflexi bacterium]|nr:fumarylacetoacetate hydrolase family protein [Chloroflexota bacterium]